MDQVAYKKGEETYSGFGRIPDSADVRFEIASQKFATGVDYRKRADFVIPPRRSRDYSIVVERPDIPRSNSPRFVATGAFGVQAGDHELWSEDIEIFGRNLGAKTARSDRVHHE